MVFRYFVSKGKDVDKYWSVFQFTSKSIL